jgi:putative glutamine amidotransferase
VTDSPHIGVSAGRILPRQHDLYIQALEDAGGNAVFIRPDMPIIEAVKNFSGFLIPGGKDIDPSMYNEKCMPGLDLEDEERVNFDLRLFNAAIDLDRPVLGICYGMQLMNIARGGTLHQDIGSSVIDHRRGVHHLNVGNNPFIEPGKYEVNSSHHQAVKEIGKGFSAFAFSPDGIIEAFYSREHCFHLGVHWHPERMKNRVSKMVFTSLIEACRDLK